MEKIVFVLLFGCVQQLAMSALNLPISSSVCGSVYNVEDIGEEAHVTYKGEWLNNTDCTVQFVNFLVYEKLTCIKPEVLEIGCGTEVEYWRSVVKPTLDPMMRFNCFNPSLDEWCGQSRTIRVTLLFRKSNRDADDDIKMHLYLKRYKDIDDNTSATPGSHITGILICVFSLLIFTGVIVFFVIMCLRKQRLRSLPRTPYMCQTASDTVNMQTGQGNVQMSTYQPVQQSQFQPANQGNYEFHRMHNTYPVPPQQGPIPPAGYQGVAQTDFGHQNPAEVQGSFLSSSAPENYNTANPPPPYASLAK